MSEILHYFGLSSHFKFLLSLSMFLLQVDRHAPLTALSAYWIHYVAFRLCTHLLSQIISFLKAGGSIRSSGIQTKWNSQKCAPLSCYYLSKDFYYFVLTHCKKKKKKSRKKDQYFNKAPHITYSVLLMSFSWNTKSAPLNWDFEDCESQWSLVNQA